MKDFIKFTLATMCGIVLLSVLSGIMFMISLIGMVASESGNVKVKDNSVFVLKLSGTVEERAADDNPLALLMGQGDMESMGLDDIIASIRKAKDEEDIKGIYLEAGAISFDSPATIQQIRDELEAFKKAGKWIVAYGDNYTQGAYYLASVADKVYLNEMGMLDFHGIGGKSQYMKGLYDKLGVEYRVAKVGKYKSYVESNTRTNMSDYDREQRMAYQSGIWNHMLKGISESRKIGSAQLNQYANDSILALADAADYVKMKLVDKLMYPEDIKKEIKNKLGIDEKDDIPQLTLADMLNVKSKQKKSGDKIAVYYAYGEIVDQLTNSFMSEHCIVGQPVAYDLKKLADDEDVKAVVLRVNSGGGSAVASEQIWHAVKLLKAKKPVVVSMGGMAASGGYMISAAANYIYAEPTTVTGSIGIFGMVPNISGLVTDKLGVTFDGTATNKYTSWEEDLVLGKDNVDDIMKYFQGYTDRGYAQFLKIVADGRKMKVADVDSIAQGRVWIGTDALKIKLVDKLGSLDDAVKKAAELAKLDKYQTVGYPGESSWMDNLFPKENKGTYLDAQLLRGVLGELYEPVMEMRKDMNRSRLQARLPFSIRME